MATGKSTIGRALAKVTGRQFFDTDDLVEKQAGKTITQIFLEEGEEYFRNLETRVVTEVCKKESAIISFGGGVVLSGTNIETMSENCVVILLRASVETILRRTESTNYRPLLNTPKENVKDRIVSLFDSRETAYENAKNFAIDTDNLSTEEVAEEIVRRLGL